MRRGHDLAQPFEQPREDLGDRAWSCVVLLLLHLGCSSVARRNMPRSSPEMSFFLSEIPEPEVTAEALEMRGYVRTAIGSRSDCGRANAVHEAARELHLKPRRVLAILHGEARRVWADELTIARGWYRSHVERQARLLEHEAAVSRKLIEELDATWPNG
jgi:hypothetical protein